MIIPIGHEETTVQRLPWVTISIMGLCVLAYIGTATVEAEDPDHALIRPLQYFLEHRYLEPAEELEERVKQEMGQEFMDLFSAQQSPESLPSVETLELEQGELDRLTERWLGAREKIQNHPLMRFGLVPANFSFLTLFTSMFLHAGFWHLFGNMFFLFLSGPFIEDKWGRALFAAHYLSSGAIAGGAFAAAYPGMEVPLVGASGAIAGTMGAFLIRFWNTKIKFFYTIGLRGGVFHAPAWTMLPLWLLDQVWMAYLVDGLDPEGRGGGVAYWAHVCGFTWGLGGALAIRYLRIEERFIQPALEAKLNESENPVLDQAAEAMEKGQTDEALRLLRDAVRRNPGSNAAVLALWDTSKVAGSTPAAAPAMLRLVRQELLNGEVEDALQHWFELMHHVPEVQPDVLLGSKLAEALLHAGKLQEAIALLPLVIASANDATPVGVLVKLAKTASALGSDQALSLITRALAAPGLPVDALVELRKLLVAPPPSEPAAADVVVPAVLGAGVPVDVPVPAVLGAPAAADVVVPAVLGAPAVLDVPAARQKPPAAGTSTRRRERSQAPAPVDSDPFRKPAGSAPVAGPFDVLVPGIPMLDLSGLLAADPPPAPAAPSRSLHVTHAVPLALQGKQLSLNAEGKGQGTLRLDRVRAVAVACVQKPDAAAWLVLDLLLEDPRGQAEKLPLVRLLSNRFDPRTLVPEAPSPLEAFKRLTGLLLQHSGAAPLPDLQAAQGKPFRTFTSLEQYEREVLQASG